MGTSGTDAVAYSGEEEEEEEEYYELEHLPPILEDEVKHCTFLLLHCRSCAAVSCRLLYTLVVWGCPESDLLTQMLIMHLRSTYAGYALDNDLFVLCHWNYQHACQ